MILSPANDLHLKETVPRNFRLQVLLWISFPQAPEQPLRPFQIFSKIRRDISSSRCTNEVVDTDGKWKKSSIRKVLIIFLEHLFGVELTYRYIFSFKFTLGCQQSDIVPIICHQCELHMTLSWHCPFKAKNHRIEQFSGHTILQIAVVQSLR